jgi:bifunctional enzyme CysN/CysC
LHLLGIQQIAVLVNKMDLVNWSQARFDEIQGIYSSYLAGIGVTATHFIPISAREGATIAQRQPELSWYEGPTVLEALDSFRPSPRASELPLRLPLQDIYKFDERRILVGRIESGRLRVGDRLLFSPSNKTATVATIEGWNQPPILQAQAGQSVGITLDEQLFLERGEVASHVENPPVETNVFRGRLFWLGHKPLKTGESYRLKLNTREVPVMVQKIERVIDADSLAMLDGQEVPRHGIGEAIFRARGMLALDEAARLARTGRFALSDGQNIVAGGLIDIHGYPDQRQSVTVRATNIHLEAHRVTAPMRVARHGHSGGVLWFTGLSGAGKSTIAMEVERSLFNKGYQVYVLDGDNVRHGLNANLSFSPEDRAENIRRVGEVAALFADAGMIVITAFISPYRADRHRARSAAGDHFHEIYIRADLATCEKRDPKGLYKKARRGEIADFTGVSAPYEEPDSPELVVDTMQESIDGSVQAIVDYVERIFVQQAQSGA